MSDSLERALFASKRIISGLQSEARGKRNEAARLLTEAEVLEQQAETLKVLRIYADLGPGSGS
jgi:hypothetical protein